MGLDRRQLPAGLGGSITVESIEFVGARNVAGGQHGGLATISIEQILAGDPEIGILTAVIGTPFFIALLREAHRSWS
jgi:iron complex transport system substrate-binding protein